MTMVIIMTIPIGDVLAHRRLHLPGIILVEVIILVADITRVGGTTQVGIKNVSGTSTSCATQFSLILNLSLAHPSFAVFLW